MACHNYYVYYKYKYVYKMLDMQTKKQPFILLGTDYNYLYLNCLH